MPTVVVIDNERDEVKRLGNLLEAAFPDWNVLPEKKRREKEPSQSWKDIVDYLLSIEDSDVVLCLDLGLEAQDWPDIDRGIRRASEFRADRPSWTFVAFTRNSRYADGSAEFKDTFDGLLEKSELARKTTLEAAALHVRSVVELARRRRSAPGAEKLPSTLKIVDSLGMRLFRAAFSDETLGELTRAEAADWGELRVESLTSGYSGAFMLALTSVPPGRSLILKVARNEATIEHELRAQRDYLAELSPFGAKLVTIIPELRQLHDGRGVYYRQMPVQGMTVLQYCVAHSLLDNLRALESVSRMCNKVLAAVPVEDRPTASARVSFELTPVDVGRLETSSLFLADLGHALTLSKLWPNALPSAREMASEISELASSWPVDEITDVYLPQAVQHGDLNPGNVMLDSDGAPVLIDFQRLGRWPRGYDMARFAGLLRIRLTDVEQCSDWLPFRLIAWCEPLAAKLRGVRVEDTICPEAAFIDQEFLKYTADLSDDRRRAVVYGHALGSLWDLIKIISYQDISPMKRCWALVRAWTLIQSLRSDRKSL